MPSIFTRIINGEIPCHKIAETNDFLAFLDINPLVKGHTLCIPKKEVDYIFDLDDDTLSGLMLFAKDVARKIETAISCKRVGIIVVGTEVPHAHIHLVPFQQEAEIDITRPKLKMSQDELAVIAKAIVG